MLYKQATHLGLDLAVLDFAVCSFSSVEYMCEIVLSKYKVPAYWVVSAFYEGTKF